MNPDKDSIRMLLKLIYGVINFAEPKDGFTVTTNRQSLENLETYISFLKLKYPSLFSGLFE